MYKVNNVMNKKLFTQPQKTNHGSSKADEKKRNRDQSRQTRTGERREH